ncbi:unnamed protein product [Allacma fusca]|uniref:Uncharacterized protein n=1 Tax=Allacma fusca TaxID=39272 RepID=A0A8J2KA98_9HEXA|nr:unnamed protein product [Allacma fusca]
MSAPELPNSNKSNPKFLKNSPKPDPEKLNVIFTAPSNCQFYFGVDGKNKKDPVKLSETEKLQSLCAELVAKVSELESTNVQLFRRVLSLEDRLTLLEEQRRERKTPLRPRKEAERIERGAAPRILANNDMSDESMETSSSDGAITGDVIFLEEHIIAKPKELTPVLSVVQQNEVGHTPFKVIAKPGHQLQGVTAAAMSKTYPGKFSCVFEIVNWIETPLTDAHCVVQNGVIESIPESIEIAKAFGIWENGAKLSATFSYRVGPVRIAFAVCMDDSTSSFRIGFVTCDDPGTCLKEVLEGSDTWIDGKLGSPGDGKIISNFEDVRITGSMSQGNKSLLEISVSKVS